MPLRVRSKFALSASVFCAALCLPLVSHACATCGCSLSSDAAMGYSSQPGYQISLQYDYINQNQLRTGRSAISRSQVATIPDQEVENQTRNNYFTLGLGYSPNEQWNFKLLVPFIDRSHSTYDDNPDLPLTANQLSAASVHALGDIKFITSYQGILPTHNFGLQLGVKLPTGNFGGPDASGAGTVGRNPAYFGNSGNAAGEILDTSLQAGTGSTDIITGVYYYQPVSQNFDVFVNGQFQAAVLERLDQSGANFRPGNQLTISLGTRYEANPDFTPQLQLNFSHRSADQGALADTDDTRGTVAYLSPGISLRLAKSVNAYGFVQIPVYSELSGYQLFPHWTASVGMGYSF